LVAVGANEKQVIFSENGNLEKSVNFSLLAIEWISTGSSFHRSYSLPTATGRFGRTLEYLLM
jgi:hypothetical protein